MDRFNLQLIKKLIPEPKITLKDLEKDPAYEDIFVTIKKLQKVSKDHEELKTLIAKKREAGKDFSEELAEYQAQTKLLKLIEERNPHLALKKAKEEKKIEKQNAFLNRAHTIIFFAVAAALLLDAESSKTLTIFGLILFQVSFFGRIKMNKSGEIYATWICSKNDNTDGGNSK